MRGSGDGKHSFYDWHLLKPEKAGKGGVQPAILEVTYIREKKTHINHEAIYFRETKFSNSW